MRLWVDGQCFQTSSRNRGIGRYVMELLRAVARDHPDVELHVSLNAQMVPEAIAARRGLASIIPQASIHVWHGIAVRGEAVDGYTAERRLSEIALVHHVNSIAPDIAISTSPFEGVGDAAVPLLKSDLLIPPVQAIFYDAIPIRFPDQYLNAPILKQVYNRRMDSCKRFDDFLCISDFALNEARDLLGIESGVNISAGVSRNFEALLGAPLPKVTGSGREFLLYVGALDWRKNVDIIPKAIALLPEGLRGRFDVVLAGDHPVELLQPVYAKWRELGLPNSALRSLGLVSDDQLIELYQSARAVIQPSFMEGFGLTALEALICGTPVLAARAGALPEVVGSDRLMFDPYSAQELADRIADVCTDDQFYVSLRADRNRFAEQFSWQKTAAIAIAHLKSTPKKSALSTSGADLRRLIAPAVRRFTGRIDTISQALALAEPGLSVNPRLIVDASSTIRNQLKSGIQRVVRRICRELSEKGNVAGYDIEIVYCDDDAGWFRADSRLELPPEKVEANRIRPSRGDIVFMLDSSWDLSGTHRSFLNEARMVGARVISCVYDLVPLRFPGFCLPIMPPVFRDWLLGAMQYSTGFMCISKAVADEVRSLLCDMNYPHAVEIGHWRLGADFQNSVQGAHLPERTERLHPNFLMVGTLEPRKGQSLAIDAFEAGWKSGLDAHLTIVGKYGWEADHLANRIRKHPEYRKRLHWHDRVEDDELLQLYFQCDALISASYGEGFGLPIVEAGQLGVPVIASDIPVFREVAEAAQSATFFEAGSAASLLETVRQFIRTPRKSAAVSERHWPSWSESAEELVEAIFNGKAEPYSPSAHQPFLLPTNIGKDREHAVIEPRDRAADIRLVSGPEPAGADGSVKFLVAVTNQSQRPWFGRGDDTGKYGVALSYHIQAADGAMLEYDNPRSAIVLVLQPGDTHILPVTIPGHWFARGAAAIELELVQEGVSWWGNPLTVSLLDSAIPDSAPEQKAGT